MDWIVSQFEQFAYYSGGGGGAVACVCVGEAPHGSGAITGTGQVHCTQVLGQAPGNTHCRHTTPP